MSLAYSGPHLDGPDWKEVAVKKIAIAGAAIASLLISACGGAGDDESSSDQASGSDLGEITVAVSAVNSATYVAVQEGNKLGVWDDSGLTVKLVDATATSGTQALASGDADVMVTVGTAGALAQAQGLDIKLVGGINELSTHSIVVPTDSDYQTPEDLKGAKFGISGFGSGGHYATAMLAESLGWSEKDYELVVLGDRDSITAAFKRGDIDAFSWSPELAFDLDNSGEARIIATAADFVPPDVNTGFFARGDLVKNNPEALKVLLDRYYEYIEKMHQNHDAEISIMEQDWQMDPEVAKRVADDVFPQLVTSAEIPAENLDRLVKSTSFIDPSATLDIDSLYVNGQNP